MRLDFTRHNDCKTDAEFTDYYGFPCYIGIDDDAGGQFLRLGKVTGCVEDDAMMLTRGMAYALHSAIETWLDTGELPKYVECTDDPPRCGER